MEEFLNHYKHLHKAQEHFTKSLPSKCDKSCPKAIKDVKIIGKVLTPRDPAFSKHDDEVVIRKFFIVKEMITAVLKLVRPYLDPKYEAWFNAKEAELQALLTAQLMCISSLAFHECNCQKDSVLSGGVGGLNTTATTGIEPATLIKLNELTDLLRSLQSQ